MHQLADGVVEQEPPGGLVTLMQKYQIASESYGVLRKRFENFFFWFVLVCVRSAKKRIRSGGAAASVHQALVFVSPQTS